MGNDDNDSDDDGDGDGEEEEREDDDDDDGDGILFVCRAPTVPTTSRMHSSCCCPSCRSPTSRVSTVVPPQNQQHKHSNNKHTHTDTHTRYLLTRLS